MSIVNVYSEKPNTNKMLLMKMRDEGRTINGVDYEEVLDNEAEGAQLPEHITQRLTNINELPKSKYNAPQTSNQEFGWYVVVVPGLFRIIPTSRSSSTRARAATRQATQTTTTP